LKRNGQSWRFILIRATPNAALEATAHLGARLLMPGVCLFWREFEASEKAACFVIPLIEGE
jgi:hypothetical protein